MSAVDTGLSREEARRRAEELIQSLRTRTLCPSEQILTEPNIDILRAACELLVERFAEATSMTGADDPGVESQELLIDAERLYHFVSGVVWPEPDFDEHAEALAACALVGWRIARRHTTSSVTDEWLKRLLAVTPKSFSISNSPSAEIRGHDAIEISPQAKTDPIPFSETLLPLLETLRQQWETAPAKVLGEASFLYDYLENLKPTYPTDAFLLDEREYFLGETARIAAAVCRQLSLRDETRQWLDFADAWFLQTENAAGNLAKVSYQRLALRTEERDFQAVQRLLPQLIATFERLGMREDALKTRLLSASILKETDELAAAAQLLNEIVEEARLQKNESLQAWAYVNLVQTYGHLGDAEAATSKTIEATSLLRRVGNRIGLAKLHWGVGTLLRSQSDISGAIRAYRAAQAEFSELSMHADIAAVQLVIADLLLDAGQEKKAEWEIRQALPLIDEYKLVPEGFAAMTLLRESLRRQKIDRQALRNLHGYFEELQS